MSGARNSEPVLVKRYARTRLHDTSARCYVTVGQLRDWMADGMAFSVVDTGTGADVTRVLLA